MLLLSAQYQISKARKDRAAHVSGLLTKHERTMRAAFATFLKDAYSEHQGIHEHLGDNNLNAATNLVTQHIVTLGKVIPQVFIDSANIEAAHLGAQVLRKARSTTPFDPSTNRAAQLMRSQQLTFVQNVTDSQRASIRNALARSFARGATTGQAAKSFVGAIGLTPSQQDAVDNYRQLLEKGSAAALDRELRSRRFDSTVERAFEGGKPLTDAQIDRMTDAYQKNMLNNRAETIARTESLGVMSAAREEAMLQVADQTDIPLDTITRTWNTTMDGRERDSHHDMDGQQVGVDEPFVTPDGEELQYPGDPSASAAERIRCRCVVTYDMGG